MTTDKPVWVIDDERTFIHHPNYGIDDVHYIRTEHQAKAQLWDILINTTTYHEIDELWLDHDLGVGGDIRSVVLGLQSMLILHSMANVYSFPIKKIYIHSASPVGAKWAYNQLSSIFVNLERVNANDYNLIGM